MSQSEFGALVGVSQQVVSDLVARGVLPVGGDLTLWVKAYCAHLRGIAAGTGGELSRERARLAREQADAQAMKNAVERRELVRISEVEPRLESAFIFAREKLLDSVPRLARELPPDIDGRVAMLQAEFTAFLGRIADWAKADENGDDE